MTTFALIYTTPAVEGFACLKWPELKPAKAYVKALPATETGYLFTDAKSLGRKGLGDNILAKAYNFLMDGSEEPPVDCEAEGYNRKELAQKLFEILSKNASDGPLTSAAGASTAETAPEESPTAENEAGDANMAAKSKSKKAAKTPKAKKAAKAPAVKREKGVPRPGSKKAELLRLLSRSNGATMAEMLEATGWKACLGTAKQVATDAGLKFSTEKNENGGATRWFAK